MGGGGEILGTRLSIYLLLKGEKNVIIKKWYKTWGGGAWLAWIYSIATCTVVTALAVPAPVVAQTSMRNESEQAIWYNYVKHKGATGDHPNNWKLKATSPFHTLYGMDRTTRLYALPLAVWVPAVAPLNQKSFLCLL